MPESENKISLNKGYTKSGFAEKVFHIHLRLPDDKDEILFKNFLNNNAEVAKEYEKLKLALAKQYKHNRDAYTNAKADFVKEIMNKAKRL